MFSTFLPCCWQCHGSLVHLSSWEESSVGAGIWSVSGEALPTCRPASDGYTAFWSLPTELSQTKAGSQASGMRRICRSASGIIVMVRETLPWRRSWRAHCPWEACACTPCNPPPPCNNGCRAWTWCQTEPTHRNKDMRHIYFCHQENKDVQAANSRFLSYLCLKIGKQQSFMFTGIKGSTFNPTNQVNW